MLCRMVMDIQATRRRVGLHCRITHVSAPDTTILVAAMSRRRTIGATPFMSKMSYVTNTKKKVAQIYAEG